MISSLTKEKNTLWFWLLFYTRRCSNKIVQYLNILLIINVFWHYLSSNLIVTIVIRKLYRTKSELLHTLCIEERWTDWRRRMPHWFNDTLIRSNIPEDNTHATQITEDVFVKSDDPYNLVIPDRNAHNSANIDSNARPQPHTPHQAHVTVVVVGIFWALAIFPWVFDMFPNWSIHLCQRQAFRWSSNKGWMSRLVWTGSRVIHRGNF